jgi:hypothetical protein
VSLEIDLFGFVRDLKRRDLKGARGWFESKKPELEGAGDFWKGYALALNGMIASLESGQEFSLMKRLIDGVPREELETLLKDFKRRVNQSFRPPGERGFDTAWFEVLQLFLQE